jgi:hypothetical protein
MPTVKRITLGERFGRLTALANTKTKTYPSKSRVLYYECRCDCGNILFVTIYALRSGNTRSCGCLQVDITRGRSITHGFSFRRSGKRVYRIWCCMITRCTNPKATRYENYGGRGITVCERWLKFENFLEDMGEPPEYHSIDRLDNDAGYSKENCAWRTASQQSLNRRKRRPNRKI